MSPFQTNQGTRTYDPKRKVEIFAVTLQDRFTNPPPPALADVNHIASLGAIPDLTDFVPTTYDELCTILKSLPSKKSPGIERINYDCIRRFPKKTLLTLVDLYNSYMRRGYFPDKWKLAKIILIPKPNKSHFDLNNFRPISLLPSLGKVLEKIVLLRLQDSLWKPGGIRPEQFGFRPHHSASQQVLNLTQKAAIATKIYRKAVPALFLDISFAFDKVCHNILRTKLPSSPATFTPSSPIS